MSLNFWLTDDRYTKIGPLHPDKSRGARAVLMTVACCPASSSASNGAVVGQMFRPNYGPAKTLYNRYKRRSEAGVFERVFEALARKGADPDTLMIDAGHITSHRGQWRQKTKAPGAPSARPKAGRIPSCIRYAMARVARFIYT